MGAKNPQTPLQKGKVGEGTGSGVVDEKARMKLRAEIDAIVAHLYGITEEELIHILSTFPIVKEEVKQLTLDEFRKMG